MRITIPPPLKRRKKSKKKGGKKEKTTTRPLSRFLAKKKRREAPPLGLSGKGGKSPSLATHLLTREGSASPSPHWQRGESSPLHTPPARRPRTGRRLEPNGGDRPWGVDRSQRAATAKGANVPRLRNLRSSLRSQAVRLAQRARHTQRAMHSQG